MSKTCKNCEFIFDDTFNYCPNCGQNYNEDLTVGVIFKNTIHNYFSVDARFFKSFFPLLFKPGFLPLKFVEGKRLTYLHPAQFYLFASVVFFFLFSFEIREQEQRVDQTVFKTWDTDIVTNEASDTLVNQQSKTDEQGEIELKLGDKNELRLESKTLDSLVRVGATSENVLKVMGVSPNASRMEKKIYTQLFKFYKHKSSTPLIDTFYNYVPISLFVLLPIFAFFLKLAFRKKGAFAHHLVFSLYYFAFLFVMFTCFTLVHLFIEFPSNINLIIGCIGFVYLYIAVLKFYKPRKLSALLKTSLVTILFIALVIPVAFIIIGTAAFMFY
ncbi:DUF3667 domain-containing protein [Formosa haliotis]|uniref:DUF3667 domain-containing protein n=1 Tax=Formosa haliotis TaxID=1555194 RepID=UPI0008264AB0|nr:DUF3667 domain-containing protein [Formosa haliotis]